MYPSFCAARHETGSCPGAVAGHMVVLGGRFFMWNIRRNMTRCRVKKIYLQYCMTLYTYKHIYTV